MIVRSPHSSLPTPLPTRDAAPAPAHDDEPEPPRDRWRAVGALAFAGISLAGLSGCATTGSGIYSHLPSSVVFCEPGGARRCSTAADTKVLKALAARGDLFEVRDAADSDDMRRALTVERAMALLDSGKPIVVRSERVGNLDSFTQPWPITQQDVQRRVEAQGVFIDNYEDLQLFNAVERATDVPAQPLTEEDARLADVLRRYEGGVPGGHVSRGVRWEPDFDPVGPHGRIARIPETEWRFTADEPRPALYSDQMKGGFLGLGRSQDRITAYEALKEIKAGRAVTVRDARGATHRMGDP